MDPVAVLQRRSISLKTPADTAPCARLDRQVTITVLSELSAHITPRSSLLPAEAAEEEAATMEHQGGDGRGQVEETEQGQEVRPHIEDMV